MRIDIYVCRNQKLLHYTVIAMPHSVPSLRPAPNDIALVLCFLGDQKKWCGVVGQGSVYMMCVGVSNVRRCLFMVSVLFCFTWTWSFPSWVVEYPTFGQRSLSMQLGSRLQTERLKGTILWVRLAIPNATRALASSTNSKSGAGTLGA